MVLDIVRQKSLLVGCLTASPELDEKIKLREPYVAPLNVLQVGRCNSWQCGGAERGDPQNTIAHCRN